MMLPQTIITQANKHLVRQGKQEWDVTSKTTGRQFYEFFKLSIKIAHDQQMILIGHSTDNSMMNSAEKVFITLYAGAKEAYKSRQNNGSQNWHKEQKQDPPKSPKATLPKTVLPEDKKDNKKEHNHETDFTCTFCDQITNLKLTDESGTNFQYKSDQKKHFRGKKEDHPDIWYPDRCGNFLKLALGDRKKVLSQLN